MKKLLWILVILSILFLVSEGYKKKGKNKKCRKCPSRDDVHNICCENEIITYTKEIKKCKKCKDNIPTDNVCDVIHKKRKTIYRCWEIKYKNKTETNCVCKCCDGWSADANGDCTVNSTNPNQGIICENGGTANGNTCTCPVGFTGTHCETPVCDPPCLNNGMCDVQNGAPVCICPENMYTGGHCQTPICNPSCQNNGTCVADVYEPKCNCMPDYSGERCEQEIQEDDECPSSSGMGACYTDCSVDSNCNTGQKCCINGCGGGVCTYPPNTTCTYNNRHYLVGAIMRKSSCETCLCVDPTSHGDEQWFCLTLPCMPLPCMYTKKIPGLCCPICDMPTTTARPTTWAPTTKKTTPWPTTEAPTSRPTTPTPTPRPTTQTPTPRPTTQTPTPRPTTQTPTPRPTTQTPTPKPTTQTPTPRPTTQRPTPKPTTQRPTPRPTTKTPTPSPTTQTPTPRPTTQTRTPRPSTQTPTPRPTTQMPTTRAPTTCNENGTEHQVGETINRTSCQFCTCGYNGHQNYPVWSCAVIDCFWDPNCKNYRYIEGRCCPVCKDQSTTPAPTTTQTTVCNSNGITYPLYSVIRKTDCESCTCDYHSNGTVGWQCTTDTCPVLNCQNPVTLPGICCKMCPTTTTTPTTRPTVPTNTGPRFHTCPREKIVLFTNHHSFVDIRQRVKLTVSDGHGKMYTVMYSKEIIYAKPCNCTDNLHIIVVRSEMDIYGRFATCIFTVHVYDNHPPEYKSCPASIDAFEDDTISWDEPRATDNIAVKDEKIDSPFENNSRFKIGSHIVSYIATDYQGSLGLCSFLVRIHQRETTNVEQVKTDDDKDKKHMFSILAGIMAALVVLVFFLLLAAWCRRTKRKKTPQAHGASSYDNALYATPNTPPPSYGYSTKFILPPKYTIDEKPPLYDETGIDMKKGKAVNNPVYDSSDELEIKDFKTRLEMKEDTEA